MRDWYPIVVIRNFLYKLDKDEKALILLPLGFLLLVVLAMLCA